MEIESRLLLLINLSQEYFKKLSLLSNNKSKCLHTVKKELKNSTIRKISNFYYSRSACKNSQDVMVGTSSSLWHAEVFRYSQMAQRYSYAFCFALELDKVFNLISVSPHLAIAGDTNFLPGVLDSYTASKALFLKIAGVPRQANLQVTRITLYLQHHG